MCHKYLIVVATICFLSLYSCNQNKIEQQAGLQAQEFTKRYCPTPVKDYQYMDSLVFDKNTHTFIYYYKLTGIADNPQAIKEQTKNIQQALLTDLQNNTANKVYKEQSYNFKYVFRSDKSNKTLLEYTLTAKVYNR